MRITNGFSTYALGAGTPGATNPRLVGNTSARYDGSYFYVYDHRKGLTVSRSVSTPSGSNAVVLQGEDAAAIAAGDEFVVYDVQRSAWSGTTMGGFRSVPNRAAGSGTVLGVARQDELYIYNTRTGTRAAYNLTGFSSVESQIVGGQEFVAVARQDQLYVYDSRNPRLVAQTMRGFSSQRNHIGASKNLAAVIREGSDELCVYDATRQRILAHTMSGMSSRRITKFEVRGDRVLVDREGTISTYDVHTGRFQDS